MRSHVMMTVLLSAALLAGCGDRAAQDEPQPGDAASSAPEPAVENGQTEPAAPADPQPAPGEPARTTPSGSRREPSQGNSSVTGAAPSARDAAEAPREAAAPAPPPRPRFRTVEVPEDTPLPLELITALSSETAKVETPVRARLRQGIVVEGYTAIPAGTVLSGHVTDVAESGRVQGRARIAFTFTEAEIDGVQTDLRTNPLVFEAEGTRREDATKIGAGAGIGAVIGGLLGGGSGAAKGAAIGGAAGTGAVLATKGREVSLPAGTDLAATLAAPFSAQVDVQETR